MKSTLPYEINSTFVFRIPLLPLNNLLSLLDENPVRLESIKKLLKNPIIAEAIFLASPEFYERLIKWDIDKASKGKDNDQFSQSFYKYYSRMTSRCTPFGLFAGIGNGKTGFDTSFDLKPAEEHTRHTRMDMSYLCKLTSNLLKHEAIKNGVRYFANTTLYKSGDKYRYIEYQFKKEHRTHHLIEIRGSSFLELVLNAARNGILISDLAQILTDHEIAVDESYSYISLLIANQVLISELDPSVTGMEYFERILKILTPIKQIDPIKNTLYQIRDKLAIIDQKFGNSVNLYSDIVSDLEPLGINYNIKYLFQTDVYIESINASISRHTLKAIKKGVVLINKLSERNTNLRISQFIEAFTRRYETKESPLLKVLDTETGIGYLQSNRNSDGDISPLIADLALPNQDVKSNKVVINDLLEYMMRIFTEAAKKELFIIELSEKDIDSFKESWDDIPSSFTCMVKLLKAPSKENPAGEILIEGAGGNNAAQMMGRFCHGSRDIFNLVKDIAGFEQSSTNDTVFAEIVHLPESRMGNVILRPIIFDYEIPILTIPAVDDEHTIRLDDLYISVRNKEIFLRSKRLNKRIIPRLSNAHNFKIGSLPVYQFLGDLQNQNALPGIGFHWNGVLANLPFTPRITFENLILCPATWNIKKNDILGLYEIKGDEELLCMVMEWKKRNRIPDMVLLEEGDNFLLVKLDNLLCVKTLLAAVKKSTSFRLKEFLFNPETAVINNEKGAFTNEFVFTFQRRYEEDGRSNK
jgi:class I lanthipeptide synthase